jgi:hypothetical protein
MVIAPDTDGRPTHYVADKAWFDETFPGELGRSGPGQPRKHHHGPHGRNQHGPTATTVHDAPPTDPHYQLATLRRELPARVELVESGYQQAVDSAHTLMTDFEEAHRLRVRSTDRWLTPVSWATALVVLAGQRSAPRRRAGVSPVYEPAHTFLYGMRMYDVRMPYEKRAHGGSPSTPTPCRAPGVRPCPGAVFLISGSWVGLG